MREKSAHRKRRIRKKLIKAQGKTCCYCGVKMRDYGPNNGNRATVEHVQPKVLGGSSRQENLKAACWTCNNARGILLANQLRHLREKAERELADIEGAIR